MITILTFGVIAVVLWAFFNERNNGTMVAAIYMATVVGLVAIAVAAQYLGLNENFPPRIKNDGQTIRRDSH